MDNGDIIFDRVGHVELQVGDNLKRFDGLDFKFNIEKTAYGVSPRAQVGVLGLNRAHINHFSTFLDTATTLSQRKRVKVYAGYKKSGELLLFDGDIAGRKGAERFKRNIRRDVIVQDIMMYEGKCPHCGNENYMPEEAK